MIQNFVDTAYTYTVFVNCRFLEEDRKEMSDLRRQHQELLSVEVCQQNIRLKLMIEL